MEFGKTHRCHGLNGRESVGVKMVTTAEFDALEQEEEWRLSRISWDST